MLLRKIHIKRFGCLEDFTTEFQSGLNIIRGPNESGKSTLHQALLMALMAQPTHTQKATPWRSWGSDQWYRLQLDIVDRDGGSYRITKDFESASQSVTMPGGEIAKGRDKVEQVLAATVGTTSMVIMQSTLCVEQDALAEIANGQKEISQSLETVLTGSEDHLYTEKALKRLENEIKDINKGVNRWAGQPGPLALARDEASRLQKRMQEIREQIQTHSNDERELIEVESRLKTVTQEMQPLRVTSEQVDRFQKVQRDFDHWRAQEEALEGKIEQVQAAQKEVDEAQLKLAAWGPLASLNDSDKRTIDQLASRVEALREEQARYKEAIDQYHLEIVTYQQRETLYAKARADYESELGAYNREQKEYEEQLAAYYTTQQEYERQFHEYEQWLAANRQQQQRNTLIPSYLWIILLVVGMLAAGVGLLLLYLGYPAVLGIVGPAAGLLLIIAGMWLRGQSAGTERMTDESGEPASQPNHMERPHPPADKLPTRHARERPEQPAPLAAPASKPNYDEAALRLAESQLQQNLMTQRCATIDELNSQYAKVVELRRVVETTRTRLDTLLSTDSQEGLERQRREMSRRRRDAEEMLQDPVLQRVGAMSPVKINELNSRIEEYGAEQGELQSKQQRLRIKLEQQNLSKEELLQAEEALESAKSAHERAQERAAVLELTYNVLGKAREQTLKQAQERLGPATGKYLHLLTNGRYETAWIDPNLNILLQHPLQPERRISPERLSRGARDQLYMAARLGLVAMLFPKTRPPILLDDPFVHFDPQRLAAAIKMCCDIAEERQLLLFTCSDNYNHVGHHIVMSAVPSSA